MALYHSPDYQKSLESVGLSIQKKFNIDFQDGGNLEFPIRRILAILYVEVSFFTLLH